MSIRASLAVVGLGVALLSVVFGSTAQAEQCIPATPMISEPWSGKPSAIPICLVTDTSQPLVLPTALQFRVSSEATDFTGRLVQQGPGDTNLWETDLGPERAVSDTVLAIEAMASIPWPGPCDPVTGAGCGSDNYKATFQVPVLSTVANLHARIVRQGKQFVAEVSYDGRTTVQSVVHLMLGTNPDVTGDYPKYKQRKVIRPAGHQVIRMAIGRSTVKRLCTRYPYCKLLVRVQQSYPYYDAEGKPRYLQITPDYTNGMATRVVKNKHRKNNHRTVRIKERESHQASQPSY